MNSVFWTKNKKIASFGLAVLGLGIILLVFMYRAGSGQPEAKTTRKPESTRQHNSAMSKPKEEVRLDEPVRELAKINLLAPDSGSQLPEDSKVVVAWQPSHQNDTGPNWHEYIICGDIVDRTITKATSVQNVKCWDLAHGLTGTNNYRPYPTNTIAFDSEIEQANQAGAHYFISIHNDGGAPSGVLGEYLPGDEAGKKLAGQFVQAICARTGLPNRGLRAVRLYSLESARNKTPFKCLLEIGDNQRDRAFLENSDKREIIAQALAEVASTLQE